MEATATPSEQGVCAEEMEQVPFGFTDSLGRGIPLFGLLYKTSQQGDLKCRTYHHPVAETRSPS